LGLLTAVVTGVDSSSNAATATYVSVFVMLNVLSVISLMTGFKIQFLPFRLCPIIFTTSSLFILIGGLLSR
jgi:hypothetical protein